MAATPSTMLPLGTPAPDFTLLDTRDGQQLSLTSIKSSIATVIMFICNHCPYVKVIQKKLVEVANRYQSQGIVFIAINSNDVSNYPDDSPQHMHQDTITYAYPFPYLFDETQKVAKDYQAACTPDFYVFDKDMLCVYRGRFDEATPGNQKAVTGADLCAALDAIIADDPIASQQHPSIGCNIKWKRSH
jgi:thiol-disulfide isomerase/thioredoxin